MTEKFQSVTSKINQPVTYFLTGILWLVIAIILIVVGIIAEDMCSNFRRYLQEDQGTFFILILAQFLLMFCFAALMIALTYRKEEKVQKAVINESGVTFYNSRDNIINTILYRELQQSGNSKADLFMYTTTGRYSKTYLKIYLKNTTGEIVLTSIDFNFEYVILSNQFEMYRQFLRGVQCFRPDLTISRQTIEEYSLTPDFPPVKNFEAFEYIIAGFFTLAILGLIYVVSLFI
ncbi:hypothetical protein [Chryseobacterium indologenes]|uniref:hypothetical protein n=1 Tax=Chryseobacterium indologenes TaxID=253 RepID=UPI0010244EB2|nr:hypothetical protein [Chryseobacterium indologenes]VFA44419.1 Uncharacterised protein [Chryseobacterium indologenes]